jgi:predicted RNA binding protein YcfA (HicA-like mRNA interferase family)
MDRRKLERHMRRHGCSLRREGGSHSIWENPENGTTAAVPRHGEVNDHTARGICKDLGIPPP